MIAEIHGKISSSGSNLSDRLEDKLTGNFFGNLRYLPYEKGLKVALDNMTIYSGKLERVFDVNNPFVGNRIEFWPDCKNTNTELDMSIDLEDLFIGIEVKYNSSLSSEDQLLRELKVIDNKRNNKKGLLLFISKSDGIAEAINAIDGLKEDLYLLENISFAYITWEDIYEIYNHLDLENYNHYEKIIIEDIIRLLKAKGFEKFKNFNFRKKYDIQEDFFKFNFNLEEDFGFKFNIKIEEDFYEFK